MLFASEYFACVPNEGILISNYPTSFSLMMGELQGILCGFIYLLVFNLKNQ